MDRRFDVLGPQANFLGIDTCNTWDKASFVILPVPLEMTTTYMQGTGRGPEALLEASHQVELYDDELRSETWKRGIATLAPMVFEDAAPEGAVAQIENRVSEILKEDKRLAIIGGEHTVTVGTVRAYRNEYLDLSVLHLDAHADLRQEYEGSAYNHACVMARVADICPFVSVGIRSLCAEEADRIQRENLSIYGMHRLRRDDSWVEASLSALGDDVYITLDLDVFDPSVMPAVGTPEPGGMGWYEVLSFLRLIFERKRVVGFDVVELCPKPGAEHGAFTAAKLVYRILGYWAGQK